LQEDKLERKNYKTSRAKMMNRVLAITSNGPEKAEQVNHILRHLSSRGNEVLLYGKFMIL